MEGRNYESLIILQNCFGTSTLTHKFPPPLYSPGSTLYTSRTVYCWQIVVSAFNFVKRTRNCLIKTNTANYDYAVFELFDASQWHCYKFYPQTKIWYRKHGVFIKFFIWKFSMLNIIMSYWAAFSSSRLHYTYLTPFTKSSRLLCTHINYRYCSSHNGSDYVGVTLNWLQNRTGGLLNLIVYTMVQSFYVISYTMVMLVYKIGRSGWCSGLHANPAS